MKENELIYEKNETNYMYERNEFERNQNNLQ